MRSGVLIFLNLLFTVSLAKRPDFALREEFEEAKNQCVKENGLTDEDLKHERHTEQIPESHLCFHRCVMVKTGLLNENFEVQEDSLDKKLVNPHMTTEEIEAIKDCIKKIEKVEECKDVQKLDECYPRRKPGED